MGSFFKSLKNIWKTVCYTAWFINIPLLLIGSIYGNYELQILAIINMILLSFILIEDTN
jgi:hypothetical protein